MHWLVSYYRFRSYSRVPAAMRDVFTGYLYASGFISNCAITVWSALHQPTFKDSVFLSRKFCSVSGCVLPLTVTSYVTRVATDRFGRRAFSVTGPQLWNHAAAGYHMGYQRQHIGLFQASAEDVPVSVSGRLVAADSTSKERFWRGLQQSL